MSKLFPTFRKSDGFHTPIQESCAKQGSGIFTVLEWWVKKELRKVEKVV
jgi:hypothetical protein